MDMLQDSFAGLLAGINSLWESVAGSLSGASSPFGPVADMIAQGGLVAYVLVGVGVWALVLIVLKLVHLRRDRILRPSLVKVIEQLLVEQRLPEATAYCKKHPAPITRVILTGILNYDRNEAELRNRLEEAGRQEVPAIRRHLTTLRSIAVTAPLLGLFGTVTGMIQVFDALSAGGAIRATDLAGGISQALVTTAVGLVIAVPVLAFYNSFARKVSNLIIEMEKITLGMAAILKRGNSAA